MTQHDVTRAGFKEDRQWSKQSSQFLPFRRCSNDILLLQNIHCMGSLYDRGRAYQIYSYA